MSTAAFSKKKEESRLLACLTEAGGGKNSPNYSRKIQSQPYTYLALLVVHTPETKSTALNCRPI